MHVSKDMIRFSIAICVDHIKLETQNSAEGPINIKLKFHLFTAIFSTGAAVIIGHNKNSPYIVQSLVVPEVLLRFDISTSHYQKS